MRRLTILLAAVGALLLVPAAAAFASTATVEISGTGSGELSSVGGQPFEAGGEGSGEFEGNPPIECSYASPGPQTGVCSTTIDAQGGEYEEYFEEEEGLRLITVKASPAPGSEFTGFTVEEGFPLVCEEEPEADRCFAAVAVPGNIKISATFTAAAPPAEPNLKVNVEEGEGTVVSSPAGISCGSECEAAFEEGEAVTLTASPAPGYLFKSWKKCDKKEGEFGVNGRQCTVKSTSELKEVGAKFVKVWDLTISKAGGLGIAKSKPGGIVCAYNCLTSTAAYKEGKEVEVAVKPAKHFHLVEYLNGTGSAAGCSGTECKFLPEADSSIEVLFEEDAKNALSLEKEGGGQGFVKTKPSGILCGYTCSAGEAEFYAAETVEVITKLNKGTSSVEWTTSAGTCEGTVETTESVCTVPMSSAHELVAKFE